MSGGELFWHLQKEGRFDEKRAKFYIAELILAIQHLHNNDIVYRDLIRRTSFWTQMATLRCAISDCQRPI
jgi:hypothetical protein